MSSIGIIANPASGKDIRRLVSHATVIDNNEKVNIVKRIVLGAQAFGVKDVYIMPDTFQTGYKVNQDLASTRELKCNIKELDIKMEGDVRDTIKAAAVMEEKQVGCLVVLGGDGTNRAAAKSIINTPLIGLSTGTNNVYPEMLEGTVAGIAAAVVASGQYDVRETCIKDKRIEIYKNTELIDIALVDAVISKNLFVGSKAIWNMEDIKKVIVSRAHPTTIGFSSIVGYKMSVTEQDDFGVAIDLIEGKDLIKAPIAAGMIREISLGEPEIIKLNDEYVFKTEYKGIIALDGEREIPFFIGDRMVFKITRNGPFHVDIGKTLRMAQKDGFFLKK